MIKSIGEIAKVGAGQSAPQNADAFSNIGTPFIRAGSLEFLCKGASLNKLEQINDHHAKIHKLKLYSSGTILFAKSGMSAVQDRVFVLPKPAHVVSHLATIEVKNGVDSKFLGYFFQNFKTSRLIQDSAYPSISLEAIENVVIDLPKPDEQKRIAAILDKAARLRRQLRFAQTLSHSFLQSVFIKMFGDSVNNPKRWETDSLDNLSHKITDGEHLNPNFTTEGYPIVMAQHVDNNSVNLSNCRFVSSEDYLKFTKKCNPEQGDVLLVSRGATIGRACVVDTKKKFCMMGSVILIKPKKTSVNADFLNQLFKTTSYKESLRRTSGSSAQEAIYIANLRNGEIIKPPLPLQENFARIVQQHERIYRQQHEAVRQAEHLFQTLLHRAFRGEL